MPDGTPILPAIRYGNTNVVNGLATITVDAAFTQKLTPGTHALYATYGGDGATYNGATSQRVLLIVQEKLGQGQEKAALNITVASVEKSGTTLIVNLKVTNTGNATAANSQLTQVAVRTLTGTGTAAPVTTMPLTLGDIAPAASVTKTLLLNVPATVQRISITETGTLQDVSTPLATFTASQMVIIPQ